MFSTADKTRSTTHVQRQPQTAGTTFFRKAGAENFMGSKDSGPSFFSPVVQAKLSVSSPDDPQEKEADAVADKVMRTPDPVSIPAAASHEEGIQRKEEEKHPAGDAATETIQRKEHADESMVQAKLFGDGGHGNHTVGAAVPLAGVSSSAGTTNISRKSLSFHPSDTLRQSGRGPPSISIPFEQTLSFSKGIGSALPSNTQQFMESRFNADFSGIRIHTGTYAEAMSRQINAQAFAHGNDIYFNSGKFSPQTLGGGVLLAHELSHTIQQGGSKQKRVVDTAPKKIDQTRVATGASTAVATENSISQTDTVSNTHKETVAKENTGKDATGKNNLETRQPSADGASGEPLPAEGAGAKKKAAPAINILMPEPPAELNAASKKRLKNSQGRATASATIHATVPGADKNTADARDSVEQPKEETDAKAGEKLVAALDEKPAPSPEIIELCDKIRKVIRDKRPPDEDNLVNADPEEAAKEAGGEVKESIDGEVEKVDTNYDDLQKTPEGQKDKEAHGVEPTDEHADAPGINATAAVPDAVPKENISLDGDVASTDKQISDSGMNSTTGQLVQDGPIAAARAAHGELQQTAAEDPAAVEAAQQQTLAQAAEEMHGLQSKALQALTSSRTKTVGGVDKQQKDMKESEEDKRLRVGAEAEAKFTKTQGTVTDILKGLSAGAMKNWDAGVTIASAKFKATLKKVKDWIDDRHSGVGGFFNRIGDAIGGLPDWVTEEYDKAEKLFGDEVCELITKISTEVNTIIAACEKMIDDTLTEISKLFKDSFGELDTWATAELGKFEMKIKGLHDQVATAKDKFNKELAGKASKSVQDVREEVHALREKAKGLIGRIATAIGEFIDDPIKFIIEGLLNLLGIPIPAFWRLVNKIKTVIGQIADDPMLFANNLVDALGKGFSQFLDNFPTHFKKGFLTWITSGFGSVGVQLPKDFSAKSMVMFFLQLMGISWESIRKLVAKHIGEENVEHIEKAFGIISGLIQKDTEGILEFVKDLFSPENLLNQIMDAVVDFAINLLVKRVAIELLKLFNPVGAILKAIELIYGICKWIFENAAKIFTLVETIVNGVGNLLSGNIAGMANAIEKSLTILIAPIIDFLAGLIGLGDLPNQIADLIKGFQAWVNKMLDRAIGWLADQAKKLLKKIGIGKDEPEKDDKLADTEVGKVVRFTAGGENHKIWVVTTGAEPKVMMASDEPGELSEKVKEIKSELPSENLGKGNENEKRINGAEKEIIKEAIDAKQKIHNAEAKDHTKEQSTEAKKADDKVENKEDQVIAPIVEIINLAKGPVALKVGTALRRKEAKDWTHGVISEIDKAGTKIGEKSVTIQFGRDVQGGGTTHIPIATLQKYLGKSPESLSRGEYALDDGDVKHRKYEPVDLIKVEGLDGFTKITYKTKTDALFMVKIDHQKETHTVKGENLQLKNFAGIEGRGVLQTPALFIKNANLNRAHLIADRFMGSGFTQGLNLITTSADYNQKTMKAAEDALVTQIVQFPADRFGLTVSAQLGNLTTGAVRDGVNAGIEKEEISKEDKESLKTAVASFASTHANFKVCLKVTYEGVMRKPPAETKAFDTTTIGPDIYISS